MFLVEKVIHFYGEENAVYDLGFVESLEKAHDLIKRYVSSQIEMFVKREYFDFDDTYFTITQFTYGEYLYDMNYRGTINSSLFKKVVYTQDMSDIVGWNGNLLDLTASRERMCKEYQDILELLFDATEGELIQESFDKKVA